MKSMLGLRRIMKVQGRLRNFYDRFGACSSYFVSVRFEDLLKDNRYETTDFVGKRIET